MAGTVRLGNPAVVPAPTAADHATNKDYVDSRTITTFFADSYGAVGDGTTADHVALQDLLDDATTAGVAAGAQAIVELTSGKTYLVNKYLLIGSQTWLKMNGATIKAGGSFLSGGTAPDGGGYSMIQATGGTRENITISDGKFDGNESANRASLSASGVRLNSYLVDMRDVTGLLISRVTTRNTWTYNIMVFECTEFEVAFCNVKDPGTTGTYNQLDGIHILSSSKGSVHHNRVDNRTGGDADDAIAVHVLSTTAAITDVSVHDNILRGGANGHGIQIAGDQTATISHVEINNNLIYDSPIGIASQWFSGSSGATISYIIVKGNTIRDVDGRGIDFYSSGGGHHENIKILGNTIDGDSVSSTAPAIGVGGVTGTRGFVIVGNHISGGYTIGIELEVDLPVRDCVIASNIVDLASAPNAPIGLKLASCLDVKVIGNIITGRGTTDGQGIRLGSTSGNTATNNSLIGNRVRAFNTGIQVTNSLGNNPTNTAVHRNNANGNTTDISLGTAEVTRDAAIATLSNVANGGTMSADANAGNLTRVTTTGATATLAVPSNGMDGSTLKVQVTTSGSALSLSLNASIVNCSGATAPISVGSGKKCFLGLERVSTTWYLLAVSVEP